MSWVNDLASALGLPAGVATLALAMYAACTAAEKAARPEALRDIERVLHDASWSKGLNPSAVIERVFVWTFGERHLSWKCIRRSAAGTVVFALIGCLLFPRILADTAIASEGLAAKSGVQPGSVAALGGSLLGVVIVFLFFGVLPDYASLWKTRGVLNLVHRHRTGLLTAPILDVILSILISLVSGIAMWVALGSLLLPIGGVYLNAEGTTPLMVYDSDKSFAQLIVLSNSRANWHWILSTSSRPIIDIFHGQVGSVRGFLLFSTLFTSVWTTLVVLSTVILKLLVPIQHFTVWYLPTEEHPIRAIGIVSAALVMIGSLIWTILRAII